ncbi:hypothetical protein TWF694_003296 [Orbilia ellipsospora]|uniref:Uncharacterized protein n=1 Tax=Orbilia ellipsospora TaxID=2528407 RepID=A0AAV9X2D1_9PEZI
MPCSVDAWPPGPFAEWFENSPLEVILARWSDHVMGGRWFHGLFMSRKSGRRRKATNVSTIQRIRGAQIRPSYNDDAATASSSQGA